MAIMNITALTPALKQLYPWSQVENLVYKKNPLLSMIGKFENFGGELLKYPLIYGNPQGRSATFSNAQANRSASALKAFYLTRVSDYASAVISNEAILASQGNSEAFLKALTLEIDGALQAVGRSIAISLYRNSGGSIGRVANSNFATPTVTLTNIDDITNFEINQAIRFSATDGTSGSVRAGTGYVVAIDRIAGTFQMATAMGGTAANISTVITSPTQNDYIFVDGDFGLKLSGLQSWIPATVSGSDSFFQVNRSADRTRLAGLYIDASGYPIEEALIDAAAKIAREGGSPDKVFMNYRDFASLEKSLGAKVQYVDMKSGSEGAFSFRGMVLNGPNGTLEIVPDQNCPSGEAFVLQMDTWELCSLGKAPTLFDTDGVRMLRDATTDAVEIRIFAYLQLACKAPGFNTRVKLR